MGTILNQLMMMAGGKVASGVTGALWVWGANDADPFWSLGLGDGTPRSSPTQVGALTTWTEKITLGNYYCEHAIKSDGTLWAWGYNTQGGLGLGDITSRSAPVQVGLLTDWKQVSSGGVFVGVIKTNGTLWTWGYNNYGQLGQGDTTDRSSPTQVGALTDWSTIVVADGMMAALKTDNTLWTWGSNSNGKLGLGDNTNRSSPVKVGAATDWKAIGLHTYGGGTQMFAIRG